MDKTPCKNTAEWFKSLSGIDSTEEALKWVMPSVNALQNRVLKRGDTVDEIPALCYAAALMAFNRAVLSEQIFSYNSIKAGDITLKANEREGRKSLKEALEMALAEAKPYLKSGMIFKSMDGGAV